MTEKVTVYTEEVVARLRAEYEAQEGNYEAEQGVVVKFAEELGVKPASVRAKLVREGVYNAKEATRAPRARKAELVTQLAELVEVPEIEFDSFEKATRKALERLVGRVRAKVEAAKTA